MDVQMLLKHYFMVELPFRGIRGCKCDKNTLGWFSGLTLGGCYVWRQVTPAIFDDASIGEALSCSKLFVTIHLYCPITLFQNIPHLNENFWKQYKQY